MKNISPIHVFINSPKNNKDVMVSYNPHHHRHRFIKLSKQINELSN